MKASTGGKFKLFKHNGNDVLPFLPQVEAPTLAVTNKNDCPDTFPLSFSPFLADYFAFKPHAMFPHPLLSTPSVYHGNLVSYCSNCFLFTPCSSTRVNTVIRGKKIDKITNQHFLCPFRVLLLYNSLSEILFPSIIQYKISITI